MVLLRSGKDVPFLGTNIPRKNRRQIPEDTSEKESENIKNKKYLQQAKNLSSKTDENTRKTNSLPDMCQNTSRSSVSSNDSTEKLNLSVADSSMSLSSDQSTMIDDTLELSDCDDLHYTEHEDQSFSNSHDTNTYRNYADSSQSILTQPNPNATSETQSNICGVADLSWF